MGASQTYALQTHVSRPQIYAPTAKVVRQHEPTVGQGSNAPLPWVSESHDLLGSEATAGIEPAMKVLQIDGPICNRRLEKPSKLEEIATSD